MNKLSLILVSAALGASVALNGQIITQWDFNRDADSNLPDANNPAPSIGNGTASALTVTGLAFFSGNANGGSSDPNTSAPTGAFGNNGWQLPAGWPDQGVGSGTAGARFDVSTSGFSAASFDELVITFDLRLSNASSRWYQLDYTVDGGNNWILGTPTRLGEAANAGDTWFNQNSLTLSNAAVFDNSDFGFRIVSVFSAEAFTEASSGTEFIANSAYEVARNTTSTYGGGTWRFDMVTVTAIPEPRVYAAIAGLAMLGLALWRRRRA
ncbi:MAG: hypothetical protein JJT96_05200 [Opitutales bacterium]|nr:hypothetical protein [Opitutales bacterium]